MIHPAILKAVAIQGYAGPFGSHEYAAVVRSTAALQPRPQA